MYCNNIRMRDDNVATKVKQMVGSLERLALVCETIREGHVDRCAWVGLANSDGERVDDPGRGEEGWEKESGKGERKDGR
jgi:hypothetical protein